jgi:hypothetical protein
MFKDILSSLAIRHRIYFFSANLGNCSWLLESIKLTGLASFDRNFDEDEIISIYFSPDSITADDEL